MDEKAYITFVKRKKKKVNGKINKKKFKNNLIKNEKYSRVSALNKNITKKIFLYTLFKSFIKPYNEQNSAFYSILCIINNIYKCRYFTKHRCLICKPIYEKEISSKEEKPYNSDGDELFTYSVYYNRNKMNLIESNKLKMGAENDNSTNTGNNQCGIKNKPSEKILNYNCLTKYKTQNSEHVAQIGDNNQETEKERKRIYKEETINNEIYIEKEITEDENRKLSSDTTKSNINSNKTKVCSNSKHNVLIINETQPSTCSSQNPVNLKFSLTNFYQYNFLSHEKANYVDVYNFDLFDKINMHDKILLDLNQNEIHPNILRAGIFFNKYCNTTHNHRNVDLLIALKSFIKDYILPPYEPINKHMKIAIDKGINYIIMCKKHSVSMGEVIRWFKNMICEHIGKGVLEETKQIITNNMNNYIRSKIVIPSINISNYISESVIEDNDMLLLYTFDYVIYLSIVKAKKKGINFEIILVDSEPYQNSHNIKLYTKLGIPVTYTLISGLFYNIKRCTKILLGIDAVIHNSVYGYAGTSIICMMANINNVHVYIICETYKISNKIIIDSFNMNNINNNLDIYDYIYLHHYHNSNTHFFSSKKKKNVDHGSIFSEKLNTYIHSFLDLKINHILFNNANVFNKPTITYSTNLSKLSFIKSKGKSKNTDKGTSSIANNNVSIDETLTSSPDKIDGINIEQHGNSSNNFEARSNMDYNPFFFKNKKKSIKTEQSLFTYENNCKEETNKSTKKEYICNNVNTYEETSIKVKEQNSFFNSIKEVNNISTKNVLKQKINILQECKTENTNISFNTKQSSLNFKNHFDAKESTINSQVYQNESEDEYISCNQFCDSICNSIGNVNIKNICTDKYNEYSLFSSVFSHINKINLNSDKSFYVANICNDVTPLKYISYIITEVGVYTSINKNALNAFIQNNI